MAFGVNKKYFSFFLNPYLLYQHYKRRKYVRKYDKKNISLGLGVSINDTIIGNYVHLGNNVSINNSSIGNHSYVNSKTIIDRTKIGKFCSIGSNVKFGLGIHPTHLISTHPAFYSDNKVFKTFADKQYFKEYGNITLGNDVWVGSNVIIMDNVNIGNGSIIAAGAIVTKDVKNYAIVGGVPAKHIKYRLEEEMIKKVVVSRWWDNEEDWFERNYKSFLDLNKFLKIEKRE